MISVEIPVKFRILKIFILRCILLTSVVPGTTTSRSGCNQSKRAYPVVITQKAWAACVLRWMSGHTGGSNSHRVVPGIEHKGRWFACGGPWWIKRHNYPISECTACPHPYPWLCIRCVLFLAARLFHTHTSIDYTPWRSRAPKTRFSSLPQHQNRVNTQATTNELNATFVLPCGIANLVVGRFARDVFPW